VSVTVKVSFQDSVIVNNKSQTFVVFAVDQVLLLHTVTVKETDMIVMVFVAVLLV